jgi:hypothetical protein
MCVDGSYDPDYAEGDPRFWRTECTQRTLPIKTYFEDLKREFEDLKWLPHFYYGRPIVMFPGDSPKKAKVCHASDSQTRIRY